MIWPLELKPKIKIYNIQMNIRSNIETISIMWNTNMNISNVLEWVEEKFMLQYKIIIVYVILFIIHLILKCLIPAFVGWARARHFLLYNADSPYMKIIDNDRYITKLLVLSRHFWHYLYNKQQTWYDNNKQALSWCYIYNSNLICFFNNICDK